MELVVKGLGLVEKKRDMKWNLGYTFGFIGRVIYIPKQLPMLCPCNSNLVTVKRTTTFSVVGNTNSCFGCFWKAAAKKKKKKKKQAKTPQDRGYSCRVA